MLPCSVDASQLLPTCYAMAVDVNHTALAIGFRILLTENDGAMQ